MSEAPLENPPATAQRHEPDTAERPPRGACARPPQEPQLLVVGAHTHGDHEPAAHDKLIEERLGNRRRDSGHDDRVVWPVSRSTQHRPRRQCRDVLDVQAPKPHLGRLAQGVHELNGDDIASEAGEDRGLITRPSANLEDMLVAIEGQRLGHDADDERLRDRLAFADGERGVFVGEAS